MIIWDKKDPWGPNEKDKCALCGDRLRLPVVAWQACHTDDEGWLEANDAFICNECCACFSRGLSLDMRQLATTREAQRPGFRDARPSGSSTLIKHEGDKQ
jgi:hypothetical protein